MERKNGKSQNAGSFTIEVSLLMPLCMLMVYLFIMYLLFMIQVSNSTYQKLLLLYEYNTVTEENQQNWVEESELFKEDISFSKNQDDFVKNIRRWQLAIENLS